MPNVRGFAAGSLIAAACAVPSHATTVALSGDGQWNTFTVSQLDSQTFGLEWIDAADSLSPDFGSPLDFTFDIAAGSVGELTVVDAGLAGDTYGISNFGAPVGSTSAVATVVYDPDVMLQFDYDIALADPRFSSATFTLAPGSYRISGILGQSVLFDDGTPLNSSFGGIRLSTLSPVPEPSSLVTLLAGLAVLAAAAARRRP